jgi:hypothetical protein
VAAQHPEVAQRGDQAQVDVGTGRGLAPVERGAQVVVVGLEAPEPGRLVGSDERARAPLAKARNQSRCRSRVAAASSRSASFSPAYWRIVSRSR